MGDDRGADASGALVGEGEDDPERDQRGEAGEIGVERAEEHAGQEQRNPTRRAGAGVAKDTPAEEKFLGDGCDQLPWVGEADAGAGFSGEHVGGLW